MIILVLVLQAALTGIIWLGRETILVHLLFCDDIQLTGADAAFIYMPSIIQVMESDGSAQVCVELSGLVSNESLGCAVTVILDIQEGSLASMLMYM